MRQGYTGHRYRGDCFCSPGIVPIVSSSAAFSIEWPTTAMRKRETAGAEQQRIRSTGTGSLETMNSKVPIDTSTNSIAESFEDLY